MTIQFLLAYYKGWAFYNAQKRPLAHFSKKGPGRKHQQGKRDIPLTLI